MSKEDKFIVTKMKNKWRGKVMSALSRAKLHDRHSRAYTCPEHVHPWPRPTNELADRDELYSSSTEDITAK